MLSDVDLAVIRRYGIEDEGNDLSRPASFVIGADGTIRFLHLGDNPRDRPDVSDLLGAL